MNSCCSCTVNSWRAAEAARRELWVGSKCMNDWTRFTSRNLKGHCQVEPAAAVCTVLAGHFPSLADSLVFFCVVEGTLALGSPCLGSRTTCHEPREGIHRGMAAHATSCSTQPIWCEWAAACVFTVLVPRQRRSPWNSFTAKGKPIARRQVQSGIWTISGSGCKGNLQSVIDYRAAAHAPELPQATLHSLRRWQRG